MALKKFEVTRHGNSIVLVFLMVLLGLVLLSTAWVSEDAYITFRTVDNFTHGYGLRWNVTERVQTYTHPLWFLVISGVYFLTSDVYYSSIAVSIVLTLLTGWLLATRLAVSQLVALLGLVALLLSKAFVDYSTSGLENSLIHLLLVLFVIFYLSRPITQRSILAVSVLASLLLLTRMDTALLVAPALLYLVTMFRQWRGVVALVLGLVPFVLWELFSLWYYGFLFPNTAYAKLGHGVSRGDLILQGFYYLQDSLIRDPMTLSLMLLVAVLLLAVRQRRLLVLALGIFLYLVYVIYVGADYMSGRFLTAPFLVAVSILVSLPLKDRQQTTIPAVFALALLSFWIASYLTGGLGIVEAGNRSLRVHSGVADERAHYWYSTRLPVIWSGAEIPRLDNALEGLLLRQSTEKVVVRYSVGVLGFFAGPNVHIVDPFGLGDPLLSRLPISSEFVDEVASKGVSWRIGHFARDVPDGYFETIEQGANVIADADLAAYHEALSLITRGSLFNGERLAAIWRMNIGHYDHLRQAYAERIR